MPLELARTPDLTREQLARTLRNAGIADDRRRDHVRIITGPQPYRHVHFTPDQFFRVEPASGIVHTIYGQRVLRGTLNYLRTLATALAEHGADQAQAVMYQIGRTWGDTNIREFAPRIEQEYEVEFDKLGMGVMLESWWWPLRASGWGTWRCDFRHARRGLIAIDLFGSAAAEAAGRINSVACFLYAGLFASAFSFLARRSLECIELACAAKGDPHCRFLVGAPSRTTAAVALRDEGFVPEQVVERISTC